MDCEVGGHDWHSGRDGGRVIDEQARFGADCEQVGNVIRNEVRPAPEMDLAATRLCARSRG